jgi:uncharacterized iron-regulated membrane protein
MTTPKVNIMDATVFAKRRSLFWRIHLWAAFIATPFALVGALTGILYIFTPQIETVLHGHLDRVTPASTRLSLDALAALAQRAAPQGATLRYLVTPGAQDVSVRAYFGPSGGKPPKAAAADGEHAEHQGGGAKEGGEAPARPVKMDHRIPQGTIIYLDPYSGEVLGSHGEMDRFGTWSKRLHSSLLQGNDWRWLLELSTSWVLVMLLTGVYLWWPRGGQPAWPQTGLRGRVGWRQWHAFSGVLLSVMALVILTTGLTWSQHAGQQIKTAADWMGQGSPQAPKNLRSKGQTGQPLLGWQQVWESVRAHAPDVSYQITPPKRTDEPWRITNFDRGQPTKRFTLLMDGYSGEKLYYHGWESFTLFNKATAVGIPFHRGEFGWWNQALLLVLGWAVVWWLVSGWVMFLQRNRQGLLGLPRLMPGAWRSVPVPAWLTGGVFLLLMPVWGWSVAVVGLIELGLAWRGSRTLVPA